MALDTAQLHKAKQLCWEHMTRWVVADMCKQPRRIGLERLLTMAAYKRHRIEKTLNAMFPELASSPEKEDQFGRARGVDHSVGRPLVSISQSTDQSYFPFHDSPCGVVDCIFTPMVGKYQHWENYMWLAVEHSPYPEAYAMQAGLVLPTIHRLMFKESPRHRIMWSPSIPNTEGLSVTARKQGGVAKYQLSSLWYETSDDMVNSLRAITPEGKQGGCFMRMQYNPNLYRAIYHAPTCSHKPCLMYLEDKYTRSLASGMGQDRLAYVYEVYWFLSQLTLFSRGSAAITEMVCSVLVRMLGVVELATGCCAGEGDVVVSNAGKKKATPAQVYQADIQAMMSTIDQWKDQCMDYLSFDVVDKCGVSTAYTWPSISNLTGMARETRDGIVLAHLTCSGASACKVGLKGCLWDAISQAASLATSTSFDNHNRVGVADDWVEQAMSEFAV